MINSVEISFFFTFIWNLTRLSSKFVIIWQGDTFDVDIVSLLLIQQVQTAFQTLELSENTFIRSEKQSTLNSGSGPFVFAFYLQAARCELLFNYNLRMKME